MTWHEWVRKYDEIEREIARDFVSTVDFENGQGMSAKSYYYHSHMPEIPDGRVLVVHFYFEDGRLPAGKEL